jgi:hypothetical protein
METYKLDSDGWIDGASNTAPPTLSPSHLINIDRIPISLQRHYKNFIYMSGHKHEIFARESSINNNSSFKQEDGKTHYKEVYYIKSLNIPHLGKDNFFGEGYIVDAYENGLYVQGIRTFIENKKPSDKIVYVPIATYWIDTNKENIVSMSYKPPVPEGTITEIIYKNNIVDKIKLDQPTTYPHYW